jgi:peptidoglycan/LPS O-acetylase OafA/YrhL
MPAQGRAADRGAALPFNVRLQSMRGIAAVMVAIGHSFLILPHGAVWVAGPFGDFRADHSLIWLLALQPGGAVIFFYVLSGFVLSQSLRRHGESLRWRSLAGFGLRRLGRLYPVLWISVLFAAAVLALLHHAPLRGTTFWMTNSFLLGSHHLLANLAGYETSINGVMWSVQVELIMIPLLPLFERLSRNRPLVLDLGVLTLLLLMSSGRLWPGAPRAVQCFYCFYLGVILPKLMDHPWCAGMLRRGWTGTLALALLLVLQYMMAVGVISGTSHERGVAVCSLGLIGYVLLRPDCSRAAMLDHSALQWVGDRSYSFYAFHMPFLGIASWCLLNLASPADYALPASAVTLMSACAALSIAASLLVAAVSYRLIELPAIAHSRRWAARLENRKLVQMSDTANGSHSS